MANENQRVTYVRLNRRSAPVAMASTSCAPSATNRAAICPGNRAMATAAASETTPLAAKQHFSMARTRESWPAPQL